MKRLLISLTPAIVLALLLSLVWSIPREVKLKESAISGELPLSFALPGWYGVKTQESEKERQVLAADTRFSKAIYHSYNRITRTLESPPVTVSIVYSGSDMNASIHRPERCLPAQGHRNLISSTKELTLTDGRVLTFTRIHSITTNETPAGKKDMEHINYYIFIGHDCIRSTHLSRTLQDIWDRVCRGYVQRWAYFQAGSYFERGDAEAEAAAERVLTGLISQLLPHQLSHEVKL